MHSGILSRFARFVLVGVLNTAFGYSVYVAFVLLGAPPQIALVMQFTIGAVWNYVTHVRLVFYVQGFRRLPAYLACYLGLYVLNAMLLKIVLAHGAGPLIAQAAILPFVVALSFTLISRVLRAPAALTRNV